MKTAGIYIHIPFCKAKCIYCDFYSFVEQSYTVDNFISALIKEIQTCPIDVSNWIFDTIFIGGGTPSLLSTKHLENIIEALNTKFNLNDIVEFTCEVNPGEASKSKLKDFYSLGVNRLSIGVQSFNNDLLKFLSRIHSTEDNYSTFRSARQAGFNNINCDLIYNIPNQSLQNWKTDLELLVALNPEHISAYSLTVEQDTILHSLVENNSIKMPSDDLHKKFNEITFSILEESNYYQYEVSNYAKNGHECLHNLHYWKNEKYLGFGPSAHSYDGVKRWNNFSNIDKYISNLMKGQSVVEKSENLTKIDKFNEIVGFGLRMNRGVDLSQYSLSKILEFRKQLQQIQSKYQNMIVIENDKIKLTQQGMLFADSIAADLMLSNSQNV